MALARLLMWSALVACGDDGSAAPADAGIDAGRELARIVAAELADEDALRELASWDAIAVPGDGLYRQQSSTDRMTGAPAPTPFLERGNRDMNHFVCRAEGAVVDPSQVVEPIYDLSECPEPWVEGVVLSRFEGSGRLARLWMTVFSIRDRPPDREVLRVYVDDETQPIVQAPLADVLDGSAGEMFAPPFGAGARTRLSWRYPVVFGSRLVLTLDRLGPLDLYYHQTDVVLDATPRARDAPDTPLAAERAAARAVLEGSLPPTGAETTASLSLAPGEAASALARAGAGTIRSVRIDVVEGSAVLLDDVRLIASWDGATSPAIDGSLSVLFGTALSTPSPGGLALRGGSAGGGRWAELRLPMPFTDGADLAIVNDSASPVSLTLTAIVDDTPPPAGASRLHARVSDTGSTGPSPHPLTDVSGRGRMVGACLYLEGHSDEGAGILASPFNFLEGDEIGAIDGTPIVGTGTEDYLDGAFYFEEGPFATPFAQVWGVAADADRGEVSGCRWHLLGDAIDFGSTLTYSLEIGPGEPTLRDRYRSVVWLYLAPPS